MTSKLTILFKYAMLSAFVFVVVFGGAVLMMEITKERQDDLHDDMIVFCEYWNGGTYSDCEVWAAQTMDAHEDAMRSCFNDYEPTSLAELGCVSGVIE